MLAGGNGVCGVAMEGGVSGEIAAGLGDVVTVGGGACDACSMGLPGGGLGILSPLSERPPPGELLEVIPAVPGAGRRT